MTNIFPGFNNQTLSATQVYQTVLNAGFTGQNAVTATAVALAESGGNTGAWNAADPYGGSVGLFQINGSNWNAAGGVSGLNDAQNNANFAYSLSNGGSNWQPWGTYTSGAYQSYLPAAQEAATQNLTAQDVSASAGAAGVPVPDVAQEEADQSVQVSPDDTSGDSVSYIPGSGFGDESQDSAFNLSGPAETQTDLGSIGGESGASAGLPSSQFGLSGVADSAAVPAQTQTSNPILTSSPVSTNISSGNASSGGLSATGGGPPVYITDASTVGQQAGQAAQQGLQNAAQTVSKTAAQSTNALVGAGTGWIGSIEQALTDLLIRGGLVLIAVVILAGAWVFYSSENHGNTKIIPIPL